MAVKRRGRGEDSVCFDQANGYLVAPVSLGYSPDGKRRCRTVRGRTKTEVRDKLRELREEIAVGVRSPAAYSVRQAIDDWLDGRSDATVTKYRHVLKPVLELTAHAALRDLTAHDVRNALTVLGEGPLQRHGDDRAPRADQSHQARRGAGSSAPESGGAGRLPEGRMGTR